VLDTANATWYVTPLKEYMDLTDLNKLDKVTLTVKQKFTLKKDEQEVEAEIINNTNKLAFQIELSVLKGKDGESVLPISWEDNYFSLLPGEKRKIKASFNKADLNGKQPVLKVAGWNIK
jgi:exo-1,4-beta-D-glucosaminidase